MRDRMTGARGPLDRMEPEILDEPWTFVFRTLNVELEAKPKQCRSTLDCSVQARLFSSLISGMNRAMTMKPTMRPRITTIIGSSKLINPSTRTETSSS
jgi:hypothetical protein